MTHQHFSLAVIPSREVYEFVDLVPPEQVAEGEPFQLDDEDVW